MRVGGARYNPDTLRDSFHDVRFELDGWELFFAELAVDPSAEPSTTDLLSTTAGWVRDTFDRETLAAHPPVAALRRLFKSAGCDPSRYRPASEALVRRLLKGDALPAIHPLVDVNNCLSARLAVPCCVMRDGSFEPPFVFRSGRADESYESLRGPFKLEYKPLLLDALGPLDAPITGSVRVKVEEDTRAATLVAYLPAGVVTGENARTTLEAVVARAAGIAIGAVGNAR